VECFEDGETMFEVVERKKPDLFVLDIMLPGVDGLKFAKKSRRIMT